jgi:hypothetical protein
MARMVSELHMGSVKVRKVPGYRLGLTVCIPLSLL